MRSGSYRILFPKRFDHASSQEEKMISALGLGICKPTVCFPGFLATCTASDAQQLQPRLSTGLVLHCCAFQTHRCSCCSKAHAWGIGSQRKRRAKEANPTPLQAIMCYSYAAVPSSTRNPGCLWRSEASFESPQGLVLSNSMTVAKARLAAAAACTWSSARRLCEGSCTQRVCHG